MGVRQRTNNVKTRVCECIPLITFIGACFYRGFPKFEISFFQKKIKVKANGSNNIPENEFLRKIILKKYTYH